MPTKLPIRAVLIGLGALLLIAAGAGAVIAWNAWRSQGAQAKVDTGQAGAAAEAGAHAVKVTVRTQQLHDLTDAAVSGGIDAIRNAEGADALVHADARTAGLRAACGLRIYRDTRECAPVLAPGEGERPAQPDTPGDAP